MARPGLPVNCHKMIPLHEAVTLSELSAVDGEMSFKAALGGRISTIERKWEYATQLERKGHLVKPGFAIRAAADVRRLRHLECLLEKNSPMYHPPLDRPLDWRDIRKEFRAFGSGDEQLRQIFGSSLVDRKKECPSPVVQKMLDELKEKGIKARRYDHCWRVIEEVKQRAADGWFVVFNSLTVAPEYYEKVFARDSRAFTDYARSVQREINRTLYGKLARDVDQIRGDSYFAVVERGGNTGRLHVHVIHCFEDIPDDWKRDPNAGIGEWPKLRMIDAMRKYWKYGWSSPMAARFADDDAFGRLGWRWPVKMAKDGVYRPMERKPPEAMAKYMIKYLQKSEAQEGDYWRCRMSRGFGMNRMREAAEQIPAETIEIFLRSGEKTVEVNGELIPIHRMRLELIRSMLKQRRHDSNASEPNGWLMSIARRSFLMVSPRPPIAEQWRSLMSGTRTYSSPSSGLTETRSTIVTAVSDVRRTFAEVFDDGDPERLLAGGTSHARV